MSEASPLLRVELQGIGENLNTWGYPRLNNALQRLEEASHGLTTIALAAAGTRILTSANYVADEARAPVLILTGDPGGATEIVVPSVSHWWLVDNRTIGGRAITIKTAAGAGCLLRSGPQFIVCDGADVAGMTPRLDQLPAAAAAVDVNGQRLVNLAAPTAGSDAARKTDVDAMTGVVTTAAADAQEARDLAQAWAAGTLPGGVGTMSAREYADAAADDADRAENAAAAAADAVANSDSIACGLAGGTANALILTPAAPLGAYAPFVTLKFIAGSACPGGAVTAVVSGLTPRAIKGADGAELATDAWAAGEMIEITDTGAEFRRLGGGGAVNAAALHAVIYS